MTQIKSIFDLATKTSDLSSTNQGMSEVIYRQIQSLKSIGDTDTIFAKFGSSTLIYRWSMSNFRYWVPSRSYFKLRIELSKGVNHDQLTSLDDIAPAFLPISGLMNKIQYKVMNNTVSELSQFLPQIEALRIRQGKSGQWMREIGAISNFTQASFEERQKQVITGGPLITENILSLQPEDLTEAQLFPTLNPATDTIAHNSVAKTIIYVDADAGGFPLLISEYDYVQFTLNNETKIVRILDITVVGPTTTLIIDSNFTTDVPATLVNLINPNPVLYKNRPSALHQVSNVIGDIFPNVDVAADSISWIQATSQIAFTDNAGADLATTILVGDYLRLGVLGGVTLTVKVLIVNAIQGDPVVSFTIDHNFGVNVGNALFNTFVTIIHLRDLGTRAPNNNRRVRTFECFWIPPISIFSYEGAIPGSQHQQIELDTANQYKKNFIQSLLSSKTPEAGAANPNDYNLRVLDMFLYLYTVRGPRLEDKLFMLDLNEISCASLELTTASANQLSFDVKKSTTALTIAFQSSAAGSDTRFPLSLFKLANNDELGLLRYYIRYAGIQKSQPDMDLSFNELGAIDLATEIYIKNNLYNGSYWDSSAETLQEFRSRGLFIYHPWNKTASDSSTRVYVLSQFANLSAATNNVLLFAHHKKVCIIKMLNGIAVEVRVTDS